MFCFNVIFAPFLSKLLLLFLYPAPERVVGLAQVDHMFAGSARVSGREPACCEPNSGQATFGFDQQQDLECRAEMEVGAGPQRLYPAD